MSARVSVHVVAVSVVQHLPLLIVGSNLNVRPRLAAAARAKPAEQNSAPVSGRTRSLGLKIGQQDFYHKWQAHLDVSLD